MSGPLKLDETPVFKLYPWRTSFPAGNYRQAASRFGKQDDGMKVLRALSQYEADFCAGQKIHSNTLRQKAAQCTIFDLFRGRTLDKYRLHTGKLEDPVLRPVVYLLTGWKVVELMLLSRAADAEGDVQEGVSEEGEPADCRWPRMSTYPFKAKHWKLDDLEDARLRCRKALQDPSDSPGDPSSDEREELNAEETITSSLATMYIESRKKTGANAIVENLQGAALYLRLMIVHGIINVESIEPAFWNKLCGGEYQMLPADEKLWLGKKLLGPLQGAALIDPVFLLNTVNVMNDSPCMEEYLLTGKAVGSYRPSQVQRINRRLWGLVCDIAKGTISSTKIPGKLLELLDAPFFASATLRHRGFYRPRGYPRSAPISGGGVPAPVGSKKAKRKQAKKTNAESELPPWMKRIKDFNGNVPSLFDQNSYDGKPPKDTPNPPRDPKKDIERKAAAEEKAWAQERDIAKGIRDRGPRCDQGIHEGGSGSVGPTQADDRSGGEEDKEESEEESESRDEGGGATHIGDRGEGEEEGDEEMYIQNEDEAGGGEGEGEREDGQPAAGGGGGEGGEGAVEEGKGKGDGGREGGKDADWEREISQPAVPVKLEWTHAEIVAYMKGQCLPTLLRRAYPSGPTSSRVVLGEQVQRTASVGRLISVRNDLGVARGRTPHFHTDEQKAFWDGLVDRFQADEQSASALALTVSRTAWATTHQDLRLKMVTIRRYEEGGLVDPLDEFKVALPQLAPMDAPIPVNDLSVDPLFEVAEPRRVCTLNDLIRNSELHHRFQKAILTDQIPAGDIVWSSNRPRHLEQMIWTESNMAPFVEPRAFPSHAFGWARAGSTNAFHGWEVPPHGCPLFLEVKAGELTVFASWDVQHDSAVNTKRPLGMDPVPENFTTLGKRLTKGCYLIIPPGSAYASFVTANAVWRGGIMLDWTSMLAGLIEAINFTTAGNFPTSFQTLDFNEVLVRAMVVFHRKVLQERRRSSEGDQGDPLLPPMKGKSDWLETYVAPINSLEHLSQPWDLNRIPLPQRLSYAYARGLLHEVLNSASRPQDPVKTFRDEVYLPLLCTTIVHLRTGFEERHGKRGSNEGGVEFWEPPERRAMFHIQLDAVATQAFGSTLESFAEVKNAVDRYQADVSPDGYDFHGSGSSGPGEKALLDSGATERDIQFFWSASCRDRGGREGSTSDADTHSNDAVMEEPASSDGEPDAMDTS